jgi:hypothetical protein
MRLQNVVPRDSPRPGRFNREIRDQAAVVARGLMLLISPAARRGSAA